MRKTAVLFILSLFFASCQKDSLWMQISFSDITENGQVIHENKTYIPKDYSVRFQLYKMYLNETGGFIEVKGNDIITVEVLQSNTDNGGIDPK